MSSRKRSVSEVLFPDLAFKSDTTNQMGHQVQKQQKEVAGNNVTFGSNLRADAPSSSSKINTNTLEKQQKSAKNVPETSTNDDQKDNQKIVQSSQLDQIKLLEIYVEKSRALGLGQRLLWHLEQFNQKLKLPFIPGAKEYYLQPINALAHTPGKPSDPPSPAPLNKELLYTKESNAVFFYNDYRVVLLLDFSQSTANAYPTQTKTYFEKMRQAIGVVTQNLLFSVQNKLKRKQMMRGGDGVTVKPFNCGDEQDPILRSPDFRDKAMPIRGVGGVGGVLRDENIANRDSEESPDEESDFYFKRTNYISAIEEQYESAVDRTGRLMQKLPSKKVSSGLLVDQVQLTDFSPNSGPEQNTTTVQQTISQVNNQNNLNLQPQTSNSLENLKKEECVQMQEQEKSSPEININTRQEAQNRNRDDKDQMSLEERAEDQSVADMGRHKGPNHQQKNKPVSSNHHTQKASYSPRVYLSIVVSGLPPSNQIRLIIHNQKLHQNSHKDLMKLVDNQLLNIEQSMQSNIKLVNSVLKTSVQRKLDIQGSLQAHLENALYIMDLMNQDAKPLLVFLTDCTNSLFELHQRNALVQSNYQANQNNFQLSAKHQYGQLDTCIHRLHLNDSQILSIDLQEENKFCNTLGVLNHEQDLRFLTSITQGIHLTFSKLLEIQHNISNFKGLDAYNNHKREQYGGTSLPSEQNMSENLFEKEGKITFQVIDGQLRLVDKTGKEKTQSNLYQKRYARNSFGLFQGGTAGANEGESTPRNNRFSLHSPSRVNLIFGLERKKDQDSSLRMPYMNSFQKVIFSRASNFQSFLESEEIRDLLGEDCKGFRFQIQGQSDGAWGQDMSVDELIMNNRFVPILDSEVISQYAIQKVSFKSLIEFRSKMGFSFKEVKFQENQLLEGSHKPMLQSQQNYSKLIHKIEYVYWVNPQTFLTCILSVQPFNSNSNEKEGSQPQNPLFQSTLNQQKCWSDVEQQIFVQFRIFAPSQNLVAFDRQRQLFKKQQNSGGNLQGVQSNLYARIHIFINSMYNKDKHFSLLEEVIKTLQTTFPILHESAVQSREKFRDQTWQKLQKLPVFSGLTNEAENDVRTLVNDVSSRFANFKMTGDKEQINQMKRPMEKQQFLVDQQSLDPNQKDQQRSHSRQKKVVTEKQKKKSKKRQEKHGKSTLEIAREKLVESQNIWARLLNVVAARCSMLEWKCYFRHSMFTIMTQSNRSKLQFFKHDEQARSQRQKEVDLEKVWIQDQQIERSLFEHIRSFTTFSLSKDTFLQVFLQSSGSQDKNHPDLQQQNHPFTSKKIDQMQSNIGFCLIRLVWMSANMCECHLGFFRVSARSRFQFTKAFQKYLNQKKIADIENTTQKVSSLQQQPNQTLFGSNGPIDPYKFQCYKINVPSLLLRLPKSQLERQNQLYLEHLDRQESSEEEDSYSDSEESYSENTDSYGASSFQDKNFNHDSQQSGAQNKQKLSQEQLQIMSRRRKERRLQDQSNEVLKEMDRVQQSRKNLPILDQPLDMLIYQGIEPITLDFAHRALYEMWKVRSDFSRKGIAPQRAQIFHSQVWRWENLNKSTNVEFFNKVVEQRLSDGFLVVNRYTGSSDFFHLVKVLKAYKDKIKMASSKVTARHSGYAGGVVIENDKPKNEKVEVVVQYIIQHKMEPIESQTNSILTNNSSADQKVSIVHAQLLMSKETCFFQLDRIDRIHSVQGSVCGGHRIQQMNHLGLSGRQNQKTRSQSTRGLGRGGNNSASRASVTSNYSGQFNESSDGQQGIQSFTTQDFFEQLVNYTKAVDDFLRRNICTYHQIVKNSVHAQISSGPLFLQSIRVWQLNEELCYFKNLVAKTKRQRRQVEESVRERIVLIHRDWRSFLKEQYPELFKVKEGNRDLLIPRINQELVNEDQNQSKFQEDAQELNIEELLQNSRDFAIQRLQAPTLQRGERDQQIDLEILKFIQSSFQERIEKIFDKFSDFKISHSKFDYENRQSDVYCKLVSKKIILLIQLPPPQRFANLIEENGYVEATYSLFNQSMIRLPTHMCGQSAIYRFLTQQENYKKRRVGFKRTNAQIQNRSNSFVMFQNKSQLNLNQPPSIELDNQDNSTRRPLFDQSKLVIRTDSLKDLTKRKVSEDNTLIEPNSPIPQVTPVKTPLDLEPKSDGSVNQQPHKSSQNSESNSISGQEFFQSKSRYSEDDLLIYSETESERDRELNQIDQQAELIYYYEHLYRTGRQKDRLEYETNVSQIVRNFINYIMRQHEKIFAEITLSSLQFEQKIFKKQKIEDIVEDNLSGQENNGSADESTSDKAAMGRLKLSNSDFRRTLRAMGHTGFYFDFNFAFLTYYQLQKKFGEESGEPKYLQQLRKAQDVVFAQTIKRNFAPCPANPSFYIFQDNSEDSVIQKQASLKTTSKTQNQNNSNITSDKLFKQKDIFARKYRSNLKGTPDAFSEAESEDSLGLFEQSKVNVNQKPKKQNYKEEYQSCHNLLFQIVASIKNEEGQVVEEKPITSLSEIFQLAMNHQSSLVPMLKEKVRAQERRNRQRYKPVDVGYAFEEDLYPEILTTELPTDVSQKKNSSEMQKKARNMIIKDPLSSVNIFFKFYTVPRYVGMVQSKDIDNICEDHDEILVNDDRQEDLQRVCKLFNLVSCDLQHLGGVQLSKPLYTKLRKSQIIKSIPILFQASNNFNFNDSHDISQEMCDFRVFQFTEIQRRIIYGMLRRMYALVSETFQELLLIVPQQTSTSLVLTQKYFGYLLYNQRQEFQYQLFSNKEIERFKNLKQVLSEEIHSKEVILAGHFHTSHDQVHNKHSSRQQEKKDQIEAIKVFQCHEILFKTIYYFLAKPDKKGKSTDKLSQSLKLELDLPEEWQESHQKIRSTTGQRLINFWCFFTFEMSSDHSLQIDFLYYLPKFKQNSAQLQNKNIKDKLEEFALKLRSRVMKLLLLQEIHQKREINQSQLILSQREDKYEKIVKKLQELQLNVEMTKLSTDIKLNITGSSSLIRQDTSKNQLLPPKKPSKFMSKFSKLSGITTNQESAPTAPTTEETGNQTQQQNRLSQSASIQDQIVKNVSPKMTQEAQTKIDSNKKTTVETKLDHQVCELEVFHDLSTIFQTTHQVTAQKALEAIQYEFENLSVDGHNGIFVVEKDKTINLVRLSNLGREKEINCSDQANLDVTVSQIQVSTTDKSLQSQKSNPIIQNQLSITSEPQMTKSFIDLPKIQEENSESPSERILMEVLGVKRPNVEYLEFLKQGIEQKIAQETMNTIADHHKRSDCQLNNQDLDYIKSSEKQTLLFFPIDDRISDKLALMNFIKQSLTRRLLLKIKLEQSSKQSQMRRNDSMSIKDGSFIGQHQLIDGGNFPTPIQKISQESLSQSEKGPQAIQDTNKEVIDQIVSSNPHQWQLLYNFTLSSEFNKGGDDPLLRRQQIQKQLNMNQIGTFLGQSLTLVSLQLIQPMDFKDLNKIVTEQSQADCQTILAMNSIQEYESSLIKNDDQSILGYLRLGNEKFEERLKGNNLYSMPEIYRLDKIQRGFLTLPNFAYKKTKISPDNSIDAEVNDLEKNKWESYVNFMRHINRKPKSCWLQVHMSQRGKLKEDLFIRYISLLINQAIYDCVIESYLTSCLQDHSILNSSLNDRKILPKKSLFSKEYKFTQIKQKRETFEIQCKDFGDDQSILLIKDLLDSNFAVSNPLVQKFEKLVFESGFETNEIMMFNLFKSIHFYLRKVLDIDDQIGGIKAQNQHEKLTQIQVENSSTFILAVKHVDNSTQQLKNLYLLKSNLYDEFETRNARKQFKKCVRRSETLIRNIRVEFELFVGSFKFNITALSIKALFGLQEQQLTLNPKVQIADLTKKFGYETIQVEKLDEIQSSPDIVGTDSYVNLFENLKGIKDLSQCQIKTNQEPNLRLKYQRNVLLRLTQKPQAEFVDNSDSNISIGGTKLELTTFNVKPSKVKEINKLIKAASRWQSLRQEFLHRNIAQQQGVLYAEQDFQAQGTIVKTPQELYQLIQTDMVYYQRSQKEHYQRIKSNNIKQVRQIEFLDTQESESSDKVQKIHEDTLITETAKIGQAAVQKQLQENLKTQKEINREAQANIEDDQIVKMLVESLFKSEPRIEKLNQYEDIFTNNQAAQIASQQQKMANMKDRMQYSLGPKGRLANLKASVGSGSQPRGFSAQKSFAESQLNVIKQTSSLKTNFVNFQELLETQSKDQFIPEAKEEQFSVTSQMQVQNIFAIHPQFMSSYQRQLTLVKQIDDKIRQHLQQSQTNQFMIEADDLILQEEFPLAQLLPTVVKLQNDDLLKNTLNFVGLKCRLNMKTFFTEIQMAQSFAKLVDKSISLLKLPHKKENLGQQGRKWRNLILKLRMGKQKDPQANSDLASLLKMLISQSRLVYSGITSRLFRQDYHLLELEVSQTMTNLTKNKAGPQNSRSQFSDGHPQEALLSSKEMQEMEKKKLISSTRNLREIHGDYLNAFISHLSEKFHFNFISLASENISIFNQPVPVQARNNHQILSSNNGSSKQKSHYQQMQMLNQSQQKMDFNSLLQTSERKDLLKDQEPMRPNIVNIQPEHFYNQDQGADMRMSVAIVNNQQELQKDQFKETKLQKSPNQANKQEKLKFGLKVNQNNQIILFVVQISAKTLNLQVFAFESIFNCIPKEIKALLNIDGVIDFSTQKSIASINSLHEPQKQAIPEKFQEPIGELEAQNCQINGQLEINDIVKSFHQYSCQNCQQILAEKEAKRAFYVEESLKVISFAIKDLKTLAFYYDFHLATIMSQIITGEVSLNLSLILHHIINRYKQPPKGSQNCVQEIKLRFELQQNQNPQKFLEYFFTNLSTYGFTQTSSVPWSRSKQKRETQNTGVSSKLEKQSSFIGSESPQKQARKSTSNSSISNNNFGATSNSQTIIPSQLQTGAINEHQAFYLQNKANEILFAKGARGGKQSTKPIGGIMGNALKNYARVFYIEQLQSNLHGQIDPGFSCGGTSSKVDPAKSDPFSAFRCLKVESPLDYSSPRLAQDKAGLFLGQGQGQNNRFFEQSSGNQNCLEFVLYVIYVKDHAADSKYSQNNLRLEKIENVSSLIQQPTNDIERKLRRNLDHHQSRKYGPLSPDEISKKIEDRMRRDHREFPNLLKQQLDVCFEDYTREQQWIVLFESVRSNQQLHPSIVPCILRLSLQYNLCTLMPKIRKLLSFNLKADLLFHEIDHTFAYKKESQYGTLKVNLQAQAYQESIFVFDKQEPSFLLYLKQVKQDSTSSILSLHLIRRQSLRDDESLSHHPQTHSDTSTKNSVLFGPQIQPQGATNEQSFLKLTHAEKSLLNQVSNIPAKILWKQASNLHVQN